MVPSSGSAGWTEDEGHRREEVSERPCPGTCGRKKGGYSRPSVYYFLTSPGAGVGLGAPELSFSAGICELAGACPLVAGPDAPGAVAAGPLIVPLCWGWGAPELSYCFGVCCCAKATPALTSNAAPAKITNCFLIKRCPVFAPYRRFIGVRQRLAYRQVPEPPLGQNARIGWPNGRDAGPKVSNFTQTRVKGRTHSQPKGPVGSSFSISRSADRVPHVALPTLSKHVAGRA